MTEAAAQSEQRHGPAIAGLLSDERLARRAVAGDERAFAAIFRRYHQRLYRYCLAIVGDAEDAQDALQNTMVKVLRALPGEAREIQLKSWLYRIAHNESVELLRRRRETGRLDPELAAPGAGLAEEAETRARLRHLLADLEELPERQRGALLMRELSGLGFGEVAAALGTSPAVARQALYEARLSLRQMDEGREMSCQTVTRALSDGDGRVVRRRDIRAHLRACADCRQFRDQIKAREHDLGALAPLPATAAAAILHGLLGSGQSAGGAGLAGAVGGGVAKSAGASALLKGAATVAVVAAIGAVAADRGGLIHTGLPGDTSSPATNALAPAAGDGASQAGAPPPRRATAGGVQRSTVAGGAARLGAARKAAEAGVHAPSPARAPVLATPDPAASPNSAATHPSGKGHEKQHPSAAAKGRQTAATHKSAGHAKSHPAHPAKPPHPANSNKGAGGSSNSSGAKPEAGSKAATPAAPGEEASAGHESGKKP